MNIRSQRGTRGDSLAHRIKYATAEDFENLFESNRDALHRLALLLTATSSKAEQSLVLALRDCRLSGSVSEDWIFPWARRAIVRNAIQLVLPPASASGTQTLNGDANNSSSLAIQALPSLRVDFRTVPKLPDFERLVFVITVLEHISIQDCALLLARSPKEVHDAQKYAMQISIFAEHGPNSSSFDDGATQRDTCGQLFEN